MHRHIIDNFSGVGSVNQRQKHHAAISKSQTLGVLSKLQW